MLGAEEGEEEREGAGNGGEVVDSESKEEEDEIEKGEMEAEDMPAVADNDKDNGVFEGDISYRNHHLLKFHY